jgi:hypothetical protein
LAAPTYPKKDCARFENNFVATTHCLIGKAKSDEEFKARTADVNRLTQEVDRWLGVVGAAQRLRATVDAEGLPRPDPADSDSNDLLDAARDDPGLGDATKTLINNLDEQARIHSRYGRLVRAWEQLTPEQKGLVNDCDPQKVYLRLSDRKSQADWASLRVRLIQALGDVERVSLLSEEALRSLTPRRRDFPVDLQDLEILAPEAAVSLRDFVASVALREEYAALRGTAPPIFLEGPSGMYLTDRPPPPPAPVPIDTRRASDIFSRVRRWDLLVAIVTALLTTLAFLLPLYSSHTFGSWEDYANLATVGFLGAATAGGLALNWSLFPALRSYSLDSQKSP